MVRDSTRAAAWYRIQSALARRSASIAAGAWDRVDPHDIAASWRRAAPAASAGVAATAFSAASGAQAYVSGCVSDAGLEPDPEGRLNAAGLVQPEAIALLLGQVPAVRALTRVQMGVPLADAMNAGRVLAGMIGAQQTADTARDAMSVAMAAEPRVAGYVRHLQAPSCGRCAVLAGRVYEWSAGFARHPACDCVHAPITSDQVDDAQRASSGKPYEYFDSLSEAEQNRRFGAAQATAIRDGESISKAVNTGRSMWRSRYTPSRGPGDLPHSIVEAVMRQTKGDRAAAVAQFKRYKLLDDTGHRRVFATERGKRFSEANPTEGRTGAEAAANARRHSSVGTGGTGGGKPPGGGSGFGGGDDPDALAAELDADFAAVNASLTRSERDAIARWQQPGRGYEAVQELLRAAAGGIDVQAWARDLDAVIDRGRLVRPVSVWRGVRSTRAVFHVPSDRIGEIVGRSGRFGGLTATTLLRDVAAREFTKPELAGGPALLRMRLPEGLPAAWLRNLGLPEMAYQMELLLPARLGYRVRAATLEAGIMVVELEVRM